MLFTQKMKSVTAAEYSEVTLQVELSVESTEVQWMRQGVLIHDGTKYSLKHQGRTHSLTVHDVAMSDCGTYSCETLHDRTQAQLAVERECSPEARSYLFTAVGPPLVLMTAALN